MQRKEVSSAEKLKKTCSYVEAVAESVQRVLKKTSDVQLIERSLKAMQITRLNHTKYRVKQLMWVLVERQQGFQRPESDLEEPELNISDEGINFQNICPTPPPKDKELDQYISNHLLFHEKNRFNDASVDISKHDFHISQPASTDLANQFVDFPNSNDNANDSFVLPCQDSSQFLSDQRCTIDESNFFTPNEEFLNTPFNEHDYKEESIFNHARDLFSLVNSSQPVDIDLLENLGNINQIDQASSNSERTSSLIDSFQMVPDYIGKDSMKNDPIIQLSESLINMSQKLPDKKDRGFSVCSEEKDLSIPVVHDQNIENILDEPSPSASGSSVKKDLITLENCEDYANITNLINSIGSQTKENFQEFDETLLEAELGFPSAVELPNLEISLDDLCCNFSLRTRYPRAVMNEDALVPSEYVPLDKMNRLHCNPLGKASYQSDGLILPDDRNQNEINNIKRNLEAFENDMILLTKDSQSSNLIPFEFSNC